MAVTHATHLISCTLVLGVPWRDEGGKSPLKILSQFCPMAFLAETSWGTILLKRLPQFCSVNRAPYTDADLEQDLFDIIDADSDAGKEEAAQPATSFYVVIVLYKVRATTNPFEYS